MARPLTPKQQAFVNEYLIDLNQTQAAIRAGYSPRSARATGRETLQNPAVRAAINAAKQARAEKTQIDAEWLLRQAKLLHDRCMHEDTFNGPVAAKALEIIGKHVDVQAFMDRSKVETTDTTPAKPIDAVTYAEVRAVRAQLLKAKRVEH